MKTTWKAISMFGMLVMLSIATMTTATAGKIGQSMPKASMDIYSSQSLGVGYADCPGIGSETDSDFHYGYFAEAEVGLDNYPHATAYSSDKTDGSQSSNGFRIHQKEIQFIMQEPLNDSTLACGNAQTDIHFKIQTARPTVQLLVTLEYYSNLFIMNNGVSEGKITLRYTDSNGIIRERNYEFSGNIVQQKTIKFNMTVPSTFDGFFELRTSGSVQIESPLALEYAGSWVESTLSVIVL